MVQTEKQDYVQAFKERVITDMDMEMDDVNGWWDRMSENILRAGKEIPSESSGKL